MPEPVVIIGPAAGPAGPNVRGPSDPEVAARLPSIEADVLAGRTTAPLAVDALFTAFAKPPKLRLTPAAAGLRVASGGSVRARRFRPALAPVADAVHGGDDVLMGSSSLRVRAAVVAIVMAGVAVPLSSSASESANRSKSRALNASVPVSKASWLAVAIGSPL